MVLKIKRPCIHERVLHDLRIIRGYVWLLTSLGIAPHCRWEDMSWEIEQALLEELDCSQEASSLQRLRKNLRSHKVYVPKVFTALCTENVPVMERARGVYMPEYIHVAHTDPGRVKLWLAENKINPTEVGERLLFSHDRQLLEDNLYPCDLHPGNILLLRNSRVTLIDFGSVGSSDRTQLETLFHLFAALGNGDYYKAADLFLLSSHALPATDRTAAQEQVVRFHRELDTLSKSKSVPDHAKSVGRVVGRISQVFGQWGVAVPWDLLRSNRAELTLDASLMFLLPNIDDPRTARKYLLQHAARQQKRMRRWGPALAPAPQSRTQRW